MGWDRRKLDGRLGTGTQVLVPCFLLQCANKSSHTGEGAGLSPELQIGVEDEKVHSFQISTLVLGIFPIELFH